MKPMQDWPEADRLALEDLLQKAEREGLWLGHYGMSGPIEMTPGELRADQAQGRFCWGAPNWKLISPTEKIREMELKRVEIDSAIKDIRDRCATEFARLAAPADEPPAAGS